LAVSDPGYFYAVVLVLHGIDVTWFVAALVLSYFYHVSDRMLEPGEIKIEASRSIMKAFLLLSAITIAFGLGTYYLFGEELTSQEPLRSHSTFLLFLFVVSALDLILLRKYYFSFPDWKEQHQYKRA
jgi:hypothetical protein